MRKLSHKQSLMVIIAIALLAVILQFVLGQAWLAQILVSLVGAVMAMTMFIEMIGTLRSGKYGVDLLAILAVVSSLLFSEYWAAMVILVMLTGGDALEDYASKKANTELKALLDNSPQVAHRLHGEATPARFVRMADRYAVPFTIVAIAIAVVAAVISKSPSRIAQVLVVASPCPLILAAPVAMVSGMSRASRNGIVVKTGDVLEKLSTAKTVAFDKTGTLTNGHLMVAEILPHQEVSQTELLQIAASVETISSHVLARSLVTYAIDKGLKMLSVSDAQEITANGVQALIQGKLVKVGKRKFVTGDPLIPSQTHTAIYVSRDDQYLGCITFTDYLRPEASQTMVQLHHLGVKKLMMLSGDQVKTAQKIGQEVGIDDVQAELLPEDKIAALKALTPEEKPVVMVGDGVNDAPSLVTADVGIAMGAHGSSAASESADLVILKDDLAKVAKAVVIAKDTIRVARQAVLIGIFICTALMLIAAFGIIPAFIGAMFQEVIDTVSILWALRARYSNEK